MFEDIIPTKLINLELLRNDAHGPSEEGPRTSSAHGLSLSKYQDMKKHRPGPSEIRWVHLVVQLAKCQA